MADIRINSLPSTATSFNTDDYIAIDGASAGTRKMLAATLPLTDVTFGTSGPSAKSSIAARAARQGLVFDGTAGVSANIGTIGSSAVSFGGRCTIPASGTNVLFAISASATTGAQAKSLAIYTFGTSLYVQLNAALGNYLLGEVSGFVTTYAGKVVDILAVRSTSGNIALYVNGVATSPSFTSVGGSAPANWQADIDGPYALLGITSISAWVAGTFYPPVCYNRALTAAEVVSLYEAGVPSGADYNTANNTGFVTGDNSTFASDTGFWTRGANVAITGGEAVWTGASSLNRPSISLLAGKRYLFTINITQASTNGWSWYNGSAYVSTGITGTGVQSAVLIPVANTGFYITNGDGTNGKITDLTLIPQGLLLAPDAAQAGGGLTWYDTSGNAANITLPASGVTWNVPSSLKVGGNWTFGGNLTVNGGTATFQDPTNSYRVTLTTAAAKSVLATSFGGSSLALRTNGSATDALLIDSSLNTTLSGNLTVSGGTIGTAASTNLTLAGGSSGASLVLGQGTNGGATITGKGAGGILLTNPVAAVTTIERTGLNTVGPAGILSIQSDAKTANDALRLSFFAKDSADNAQLYGVLETEITDATSTSEDSNLSFYSARAGSLTKQATLTSTGNLLIGSPFTDGGQKLQVNGTAYVSSDITSGSIIRSSGATNTIRVRGNSQYVDFTNLAENAYVNGTIIANTLSLFGDNGTGLSIGATGNATFAGRIQAKGTVFLFGADSSQRFELTTNNGSSQGVLEWYNRGTSAYFAARYLASSHSFEQGPIAIANTVTAAVGVSSSHKVTISIGGVTYYLLATNV